jgi:hypothetical protein
MTAVLGGGLAARSWRHQSPGQHTRGVGSDEPGNAPVTGKLAPQEAHDQIGGRGTFRNTPDWGGGAWHNPILRVPVPVRRMEGVEGVQGCELKGWRRGEAAALPCPCQSHGRRAAGGASVQGVLALLGRWRRGVRRCGFGSAGVAAMGRVRPAGRSCSSCSRDMRRATATEPPLRGHTATEAG